MIYFICEHCTWGGYHEELVSQTEDLDDKDFSYCPDCGGKEFEEVEEEDNW